MFWVVDGGAQILANVASSVIWLLLTAILWVSKLCAVIDGAGRLTTPHLQGAATGFMHNSRTGGDCFGQPALSRFVYLTIVSLRSVI